MDEEDLKALKEEDQRKYNGHFSHAYEIGMYSCCATPLGRHCPHLTLTCKPNCCVGMYGCQLDLCEYCCDPCSEKTSSTFSHYGVGISLYFKFLKWLGWTSFAMFLVVIPEVVINTWGANKGALLDSSISVMSLGNLNEMNGTLLVPCSGKFVASGIQQCSMERSDIAWLYSVLDCAAITLFFLSYLWLRKSEREESAHFNELAGISTISDYSLEIKSFPPEIMISASDPALIVKEETNAEAWLMQFFEDQVRAECAQLNDGKCDDATMMESQLMDENKHVIQRVIVASDQHTNIEFQKSQAPMRKKIDSIDWHIRELEYEAKLAKREQDERSVELIQKSVLKEKKKQLKLMERMKKKQQQFRKKQTAFRRVPKMVSAYVTFSTDLGKRVIWSRYGQGRFCHRVCCQPTLARYHGTAKEGTSEYMNMTRVNIQRSPEPSTMLWQNIGMTQGQKCCYRFLTFLVSLAVVGVAAMVVFYAKTSDPSALGKECLNTTNSAPLDSVRMFGQEVSCDGWIKEVAQTSNYGDLSVACAPYTKTITEGNIHLTSSNSLARTCGCHSIAFDAAKKNNQKVVKLCTNYIQYVAIQNGLQFIAVASVILINMIQLVVAKKLGSCQRHSSLDGQESAVAVNVLVGAFFNTGLVMLLVNARVDEDSAISSIAASASAVNVDVTTALQGKYSDFTSTWYGDVGVAISITMIIYIFSPHVAPCLRYCKFCCCSNRHGSTQAQLNSRYVGPDFHHSIRYPQVFVVLFVCMAYSTGIPILYLVISATAFSFYWVDKYLFTRWYRTPPQYDAQISRQFSAYLPYAALMHMCFGICEFFALSSSSSSCSTLVLRLFYACSTLVLRLFYACSTLVLLCLFFFACSFLVFSSLLLFSDDLFYLLVASAGMIANKRMFSSDSSYDIQTKKKTTTSGESDSSSRTFHQNLLEYVGEANGRKTDILSCLSQSHVGPMLVCLLAWIIYLILVELWYLVGPVLKKLLRCLTWWVLLFVVA